MRDKLDNFLARRAVRYLVVIKLLLPHRKLILSQVIAGSVSSTNPLSVRAPSYELMTIRGTMLGIGLLVTRGLVINQA